MKRRAIWLLAAAAVVILAVVVYLLAFSQPRYQGHSVAWWFRDSGKDRDLAFRSMGARAVPYLVAQLRKDSKWDEFYFKNYGRLPLWLSSRLPMPQPEGYRRSLAVSALGATGWPARTAVPSLIAAYKQAGPPKFSFRLTRVPNFAPKVIPKSSSPMTVQLGTNAFWVPSGGGYILFGQPDKNEILNALMSIGGDDPELVTTFIDGVAVGSLSPDGSLGGTNILPALRQSVPLLAKSLAASNDKVRCFAVLALGKLVPENENLIALLIPCLGDESGAVRMDVVIVLAKAGKERKAALLTDALTNANARVRRGTAEALGRMGVYGRPALQRLAELTSEIEPDEDVRRQAAEALWTIDQRTNAIYPYRLKDLQLGNETDRWKAAGFLGQYGAEKEQTVPALMWMLANDNDERLRAKAAITLGEIGPGASNAVSALQAAKKDKYLNVGIEAAAALKKIVPQGDPPGEASEGVQK